MSVTDFIVVIFTDFVAGIEPTRVNTAIIRYISRDLQIYFATITKWEQLHRQMSCLDAFIYLPSITGRKAIDPRMLIHCLHKFDLRRPFTTTIE